jgi:long-chain acyl-CoA synthetase
MLRWLLENKLAAFAAAAATAAVASYFHRPHCVHCITYSSPNARGDDVRVCSVNGIDRAPQQCFLTEGGGSVRTMYECFVWGARRNPRGKCLGYRGGPANAPGPFQWITYERALSRAHAIGRGLLIAGCCVSQPAAPENDPRATQHFNSLPGGCMVGLFSKNRPEWVLAEHACFSMSVVTVPLYDTLCSQAIHFILRKTNLTCVVCSSDKVDQLVALALANNSDSWRLKFIVVMDGSGSPVSRSGVSVMSLQYIEGLGSCSPLPLFPPTPQQLATMCFTSGTTGDPKGALLTHGNIVADAAGVLSMGIDAGPADVHCSYLPLAHMFERCVLVVCLFSGSAIGFFRGDVQKQLMDDVIALQPTIFPSVPRLFNRITDKVQSCILSAGWLQSSLFRLAVHRKQAAMISSGSCEHWLWDALVFNKFRKILGGRVRLMITGSAPIAPHVLQLLRCVFCCPVIEAYGMTECGACCTITTMRDVTLGHVGGCIGCNAIKLVGVPEMEYVTSTVPPRGEVCIRGPNVFHGYFKDPQATSEAFDSDGWLRSGDIGEWLQNGAMRIIDRRKNIFKLSQGEYIAPEKVENTYTGGLVSQMFVHGDSLQSHLVAVVVPDMEQAR